MTEVPMTQGFREHVPYGAGVGGERGAYAYLLPALKRLLPEWELTILECRLRERLRCLSIERYGTHCSWYTCP